MTIELTPEMLRARVSLLDTVVTQLEKIKGNIDRAASDNLGSWSTLRTVSRISVPLFSATKQLSRGVNDLVLDTEDIRQALVRAAELIGAEDEDFMVTLDELRERIESAAPAPVRAGGHMTYDIA